jgi:putative ABC transport system permease protein
VTVAGVVANEKRPSVYEEMKWSALPAIYRPVAQHPPTAFAIAVRTTVRWVGLEREMEKAVDWVDREAALGDIESMETRLAPYITLAAIGLYGLVAQLVGQRTVEIGMRKAVGARGIDIARLVAWKGGLPAAVGLFVGCGLSLALTRYLGNLIYEVTPTDSATLGAVALFMLAVSVLAMIVPLRRALRLDPMTALRSE